MAPASSLTNRPDVSFFVQCVSGRPQWPETKRRIEASDVGTDYECVVHITGAPPRTTFLRVLDAMMEADTELVVRLEDDLSGVNRHLRHNVETWEAPKDKRFGLGWLFAPGGIHHMYRGREQWHSRPLHASLGVVYRREDLPEIKKRVLAWFAKRDGRLSQDLAMTTAVLGMGRQIAIHGPSLLAHAPGPSTLGNRHSVWDTDRGSFEEGWKR